MYYFFSVGAQRRARRAAGRPAVIAFLGLCFIAIEAAVVMAAPGVPGRILYAESGDIWAVEPGKAPINLTNTPGIVEGDPTQCGSQVAFSSDQFGARQIFTAGHDLSSPTRRTFSAPAGDGQPSWSPDCADIVFSRGT